MPQQTTESEKTGSTGNDVALLISSLLAMIGAMAAYWLYPYPSGHRPDIWGFIALFLREALLLAFFGGIGLVALVFAGVRAAVRLVSRLRSGVARSA